MTKSIREQLRGIIQSGIEGWIASQFSNINQQPIDSITGYSLTRDRVQVYYHSIYPYQTIEDAFMASLSEVSELNAQQLQQWVNYHWQYAHLELAEKFDIPVIEITPDMLDRRQQLRQELFDSGYHLTI